MEIKRYSDESDAYYEARKLWNEFKEIALFEARYYLKHKVLEILSNYITKNTITIEEGEIFYRARIIDDKALKDHMVYQCYGLPDGERLNIKYHSKSNPFRGLSKEASFVPPKEIYIKEGRANPKYVRCLYMAESPVTALFEVRPLISDSVNIAQIKVNQKLKVADITIDLNMNYYKDAEFELCIMNMIQGAFSKPTNNPDDYIPSQIISEYLKSIGYEGIRFNSSLHQDGVNLTVYNFSKCEAISSQDFRIEDIKITARAACGNANYDGDLFRIQDNTPCYLNLDLKKTEFRAGFTLRKRIEA